MANCPWRMNLVLRLFQIEMMISEINVSDIRQPMTAPKWVLISVTIL